MCSSGSRIPAATMRSTSSTVNLRRSLASSCIVAILPRFPPRACRPRSRSVAREIGHVEQPVIRLHRSPRVALDADVGGAGEGRREIVVDRHVATARRERAPRSLRFPRDDLARRRVRVVLPLRTPTLPPATTTNMLLVLGERVAVIDEGHSSQSAAGVLPPDVVCPGRVAEAPERFRVRFAISERAGRGTHGTAARTTVGCVDPGDGRSNADPYGERFGTRA